MIPAPPSKGRDEQGNGVPYFSKRFFNILGVENIQKVLNVEKTQTRSKIFVSPFSPNMTLEVTEGDQYFIFDEHTYIKVFKDYDSLKVIPYFVEKPFYYSYDNHLLSFSDNKDFSDLNIVKQKIQVEKVSKSKHYEKIERLNKLLVDNDIHYILFDELNERSRGLNHILNWLKTEDNYDIRDEEVNDVISAFRENKINIFTNVLGKKDEVSSQEEQSGENQKNKIKEKIKNFVNVLKKDHKISHFVSNTEYLQNTLPTGVNQLSDDTYRQFLALSLLSIMQSDEEKFTRENVYPKKLMSPEGYQLKMKGKNVDINEKMINFKLFKQIYHQLINFVKRDETINELDMLQDLINNSKIRLKRFVVHIDNVRNNDENVVKIEKTNNDVQQEVSSATAIRIVNKSLTDNRDKNFLSVLNIPLMSLLPSNDGNKRQKEKIIELTISSETLQDLKIIRDGTLGSQLFDKEKTKSYLLQVLSDNKPHPSVTYEDGSNGVTSKVRWLVDCLGSLESVVKLRNDILLESNLVDKCRGNNKWFQPKK